MFQATYGVAAVFTIPIQKRAVLDFAVSADWTPATGDVKVSIDGGDFANVASLPALEGGTGSAGWTFPLSASELTGKRIIVQVVDSATKAVEDQAFIVETFGHALANNPEGRDLSGVAQGYDVAQITLASGAVGDDDKLNGARVKIRKSTVAADVGQERGIMTSTASNDVCGVDRAWEPALTGTVEYDVYMSGLPTTAEELADAVLDEALSGHTTAGTAGKALADIETDATAILEDTGTTIPASIAALDDAAAVVTALLTATIDGVTVADYLSAAGGANFSISGTTLTVKDVAGNTIYTRDLTLVDRNAINVAAVP